MGVLRLDAADWLRFTSLAAALANTSNGAWTFAALVRRANPGAAWEGLGYLTESAPGTRTVAGMSVNVSSALQSDIYGYGSIGQTVASSTETYILAAKKAAGTSPIIYNAYSRSTTTWASPVTGGTSLADQAVANALEIGTYQGGSDLANAWFGLIGFWEGDMSQTNIEHLDDNWRCSDWYLNPHGTPTALIPMNVAAASVVDLTGNATGLSVTGTPTLDSGETLSSFNFDGIGMTYAYARPDADISATGWTPTPGSPTTLYDKLDEAVTDDADYITGVTA